MFSINRETSLWTLGPKIHLPLKRILSKSWILDESHILIRLWTNYPLTDLVVVNYGLLPKKISSIIVFKKICSYYLK